MIVDGTHSDIISYLNKKLNIFLILSLFQILVIAITGRSDQKENTNHFNM